MWFIVIGYFITLGSLLAYLYFFLEHRIIILEFCRASMSTMYMRTREDQRRHKIGRKDERGEKKEGGWAGGGGGVYLILLD